MVVIGCFGFPPIPSTFPLYSPAGSRRSGEAIRIVGVRLRLEGKAGSTGAKIFCLEILRAVVFLKVLKWFCSRGEDKL
ncbi:hypothetical protein IEQ34_017822 [Dendrobium chrysotoxum]|uniref:Uncharacterized protein n=1 Tax=Dendrobium chrysotoxum TaxID=161865 RepID=A0AAV7GDN6_DENCH|nr:hypothetical protein IEQ34_017822 [Dendrobium chrysotoxum]